MTQADFMFIWASTLFLVLDALMIACVFFLYKISRNTRKHPVAPQKVAVADPSADADVYFGKRLSQLRQPFGVPMKGKQKPNE